MNEIIEKLEKLLNEALNCLDDRGLENSKIDSKVFAILSSVKEIANSAIEKILLSCAETAEPAELKQTLKVIQELKVLEQKTQQCLDGINYNNLHKLDEELGNCYADTTLPSSIKEDIYQLIANLGTIL